MMIIKYQERIFFCPEEGHPQRMSIFFQIFLSHGSFFFFVKSQSGNFDFQIVKCSFGFFQIPQFKQSLVVSVLIFSSFSSSAEKKKSPLLGAQLQISSSFISDCFARFQSPSPVFHSSQIFDALLELMKVIETREKRGEAERNATNQIARQVK